MVRTCSSYLYLYRTYRCVTDSLLLLKRILLYRYRTGTVQYRSIQYCRRTVRYTYPVRTGIGIGTGTWSDFRYRRYDTGRVRYGTGTYLVSFRYGTVPYSYCSCCAILGVIFSTVVYRTYRTVLYQCCLKGTCTYRTGGTVPNRYGTFAARTTCRFCDVPVLTRCRFSELHAKYGQTV